MCPSISLTFAHLLENFKWNGWLKDQYIFSMHLDSTFFAESRIAFSTFSFFFFSCAWIVTSHEFTVQETKIIVHALFITVHSTIHALKNIKNESHDTIHTFKNYFSTILSIFNFSNNKFNLNGLLISAMLGMLHPFLQLLCVHY